MNQTNSHSDPALKYSSGPNDQLNVKIEEAEIDPNIISGKEHEEKKKRTRRLYPSHWTFTEQQKYWTFLTNNPHLFEMSLKEKKGGKLYKKVSNFIKTRTAIQCKSHHQKMILKFGSIKEIVTSLDEELLELFQFEKEQNSSRSSKESDKIKEEEEEQKRDKIRETSLKEELKEEDSEEKYQYFYYPMGSPQRSHSE